MNGKAGGIVALVVLMLILGYYFILGDGKQYLPGNQATQQQQVQPQQPADPYSNFSAPAK